MIHLPYCLEHKAGAGAASRYESRSTQMMRLRGRYNCNNFNHNKSKEKVPVASRLTVLVLGMMIKKSSCAAQIRIGFGTPFFIIIQYGTGI
jgi:hypothetical protein